MTSIWITDFGTLPIPERYATVHIRRDGWPDQRFASGREMVAYFAAETEKQRAAYARKMGTA